MEGFPFSFVTLAMIRPGNRCQLFVEYCRALRGVGLRRFELKRGVFNLRPVYVVEASACVFKNVRRMPRVKALFVNHQVRSQDREPCADGGCVDVVHAGDVLESK